MKRSIAAFAALFFSLAASATEIRTEASIGDSLTFIPGRLPAQMEAPRSPESLDPSSKLLLDVLYEACGPWPVSIRVIEPMASALNAKFTPPPEDPAIAATWLTIASTQVSPAKAKAMLATLGETTAKRAIASLCFSYQDQMIHVGQGHLRAEARRATSTGPEKTATLSADAIRLWPTIRKQQAAVAAFYPSDLSNLTMETYPGAAIAAALSKKPAKATFSLEVAGFYENDENDHDRAALTAAIATRFGTDPVLTLLQRSKNPAQQKALHDLRAMIVAINWMTIPPLVRSGLTSDLAVAP